MRESKLGYLTRHNTQLANDLAAAKKHHENFRQSELRLADQINSLRNEVRLAGTAIKQMTDERNDWRDAFKLIMRLVK